MDAANARVVEDLAGRFRMDDASNFHRVPSTRDAVWMNDILLNRPNCRLFLALSPHRGVGGPKLQPAQPQFQDPCEKTDAKGTNGVPAVSTYLWRRLMPIKAGQFEGTTRETVNMLGARSKASRGGTNPPKTRVVSARTWRRRGWCLVGVLG